MQGDSLVGLLRFTPHPLRLTGVTAANTSGSLFEGRLEAPSVVLGMFDTGGPAPRTLVHSAL